MSLHLSRRDVLTQTAGLATAASLLSGAASGASKAEIPPGVTPFQIDIPSARVARVLARVRDAEWPDAPEAEDPWAYGTSLKLMKDLAAYWTTQYDWSARQARLNKLPQFKVNIEGQDIHFVHVRGSGANPQPIISTHGWPSTFSEFAKVVEPLAHPEKHGGKIEDAFSVVVPSLPGMGFSGKPPKPVSSPSVAHLWDKLMTEVLGYKNFIAQGGDIGFGISREIGFQSSNCKAVLLSHLTPTGDPLLTPEEKDAADKRARFVQNEGAYQAIQRTKPLTISYAMSDSPLGHAAWIIEKWHAWSDLTNGDLWSAVSRDEMLDTVMIYILTNTYSTGAWYYANGRNEAPGPKRGKLEKPSGFTVYPGHLRANGMMPRSFAERHYNVVYWSQPPIGGHFPAEEKPDTFVADVRAFNNRLRELRI